MRKIAPKDVVNDFRNQLAELLAFHKSGEAALTSAADISRLTEQSLLATAAAWEGFVNDMFIAYINRDAKKFREHLKNAFDTHLAKDQKTETIFERYGSLSIPAHLKKADIERLADYVGNNITFPNFGRLEERAEIWLITKDANRFINLTNEQKSVVNATISLRNHVAHRSKRSFDAMNAAINAGVLYGTGLKRLANKVRVVGVWLKAKPAHHTKTRFELIIEILDGVALKL
jgi:hypothetical protein